MCLNDSRKWGSRITATIVGIVLLVATGEVLAAQTESANPVTVTHTQTERSLLGGFWTHSTSTTTKSTPRSLSLNDVETGTLLFRTEERDRFIEAPRVDTKVSIDVTGMVARVVVVQSFTNPSDQWLEGVYAFPLPEDSAVDALEMRVGDVVITGEIMEKAQARRAYERAKRDGTRAGLVEQSRPNLFKTSVANISPRDTVNIEISYLETLLYDHGRFSLRFPLAITPRFSPSSLSAGMLASTDPLTTGASAPALLPSLAEISVRLNAGFPLRSLQSDSHKVVVKKQQSLHLLTLEDVAVPMDRDFALSWHPQIGAEPAAAIFTEQLEGSTYAKVMFMPPQERADQAALPRETVIVVDTSGSMAGASFEQAIHAVDSALSKLSSEDYFNIVQFNSAHVGLFNRAQPATQANLNRARRFLNTLTAGGGTNMGPPLFDALTRDSGAELLKQIVFITDGAVDNEKELFALIHRELGRTRLFTVGIGAAPNSYFMRKAAESGRGSYTYISSSSQVGERMKELFEKLESPVLKDIEVVWPGRNTDATPLNIPDLYLTEPLIVSAKLDGSPDSLDVRAVQAGKTWTRTLGLREGLKFRGVSTLWARDKVAMAMDGLARGESPEAVRAQVVPLALQHHLVTQYTSLVALDERPVRPPAADRQSAQASVAYASSAQRLHYPQTSTNASQKMLIGLMLLLLGVFVRRLGGGR